MKCHDLGIILSAVYIAPQVSKSVGIALGAAFAVAAIVGFILDIKANGLEIKTKGERK